jgi:hypothetical protein
LELLALAVLTATAIFNAGHLTNAFFEEVVASGSLWLQALQRDSIALSG